MSGLRIGIAVLAVLVVATAVAVVYAEQRGRSLFAELQGLQRERDELNVEWRRLQLEQSTLATHGRVERIARKQLGMRLPTVETTVIIAP